MPTPPDRTPSLDAASSGAAPSDAALTDYDRAHTVTYLRLIDAAAEGADWREATRIVLGIDASAEPERARRAWETHLERARWMMQSGYRDLLHNGVAR